MITFSGNLCVLINVYFSFFFSAMLPPSRSYDPELSSLTWQMIIYLAFLPLFSIHSHALYTSATHSSHLCSNFLFLYLLIRPTLGPLLDYILFSWLMLTSGILPSPSLDPRWASVCCELPYASGVKGGALVFFKIWVFLGQSGCG